jgi:hypothetical protein
VSVGPQQPRWFEWMSVICLLILAVLTIVGLIEVHVLDNEDKTVPAWVFVLAIAAGIGAAVGLLLEKIDDT